MRLYIHQDRRIQLKHIHVDFFDEFVALLKRYDIPYNFHHDTHPRTGESTRTIRINKWYHPEAIDINVELTDEDAKILLETINAHSATRVKYDYIGGGRFNVEVE